MEGPGAALGAPILVGLLVGFVAARIMRFRPGPFGTVGLGILSLLVARLALRPFVQAPGILVQGTVALAIACGLIWLFRMVRR